MTVDNGYSSFGRRDVLTGVTCAGVTLAGTALLSGMADAQNMSPRQHQVKPMASALSAADVLKLLDLEPNATCGSVRETYISSIKLSAGTLAAPFEAARPLGTALYFLVQPHAPVRLHRIRNDQLYHYYLGDPLEIFLLHANGTHERVLFGGDLRAGQRPQLFIPGNTFHTARVLGQWFLGASTEWPGVVPADVEIGKLDELAPKYPAIASDIRAIATSVREDGPVKRMR
jgi:predicted cupin superfamily sugar epimerase